MSGRARRERKARLDGARVTIHDLSHDGRGVTEVDGKVVFVWGALPGETVTLRHPSVRRSYDQAEVASLEDPSPHRVEPGCAVFGRCGGCALQHLELSEQLASKQATLLSNLERIGEVTPDEVLPPLTGPAWGYRRRARFSVRHVPGKGRVLVGFKERAAPYVTDTLECPVLDARVRALPEQLSELIGSLEIRDHVLQVELAAGDDTVALVFRVREQPGEADRARLQAYSDAQGFGVLLQTGGPDTVRPLRDPVQLSYRLPEHRAEVAFGPTDFVQVNAELNRAMVDRALELLELEGSHRVLELFAGLGNFSLPIARRCAELVAVEGEEGLVARARDNALANGVDNVSYHVADLSLTEEHGPGGAWSAWSGGPYDRVLLDPARAGAREVLPVIADSGAGRVVYVSCHPGSLARDAGLLVREHGYTLVSAGVMDMFPHTAHVESIALFTREP